MEENHSKIPRSYLSESTSPLVSIITATYNTEKYLNDCISSILKQTYKNFEYIIIDGGSNDGTVQIIKQHQHQLAYWISEQDQGVYDAWNKGLAKAKGDWIAFVGADDLLHPDALQTYVQHIIQHPKQFELEFVSSRIELVKEDLSPIRMVGDSWAWERFKRDMITWHVGTFHAKHLFSKYGIFDTTYKISGDYELLLRPKNQLITSFINQSTAKMRIGGLSSLRLFQAIDETYQAKIKNGIISTKKGQLLRIFDKIRVFIRSTTSIKKFKIFIYKG